jgi:hypothetical protein
VTVNDEKSGRKLPQGLDGFVRPDAVAQMAAEAAALAPLGYPNDTTHNCYFDDEIDESLPEDHPRRIRVRSAQKAVAMELLPEGFGSRRIYVSDEVLAFVAAALEKDVLHRSADPLDGCNMTVYEEGDELGWHFDQSDFSVTLDDPALGGRWGVRVRADGSHARRRALRRRARGAARRG